MKKHQTPKFIMSFMLVAVVFVLLLTAFMSWHEMRIHKIDMSDYTVAGKSDAAFFIDRSATDRTIPGERTLLISGWCVLRSQKTGPVKIHVVIADQDSDTAYMLPTTVEKRQDVTSFFDDGINYDNSGFSVKLTYNKRSFPEGTYDVYLLYEVDEEPVLVDLMTTVRIRH